MVTDVFDAAIDGSLCCGKMVTLVVLVVFVFVQMDHGALNQQEPGERTEKVKGTKCEKM